MSEITVTSSRVEHLLSELREGKLEARNELLEIAQDRLIAVTKKIKRSFPQVGRWEQTEDVFQNASLRLFKALSKTEPDSALHFYRLAALQIRRELLDMARRYDGAHGIGKNHQSQPVQSDKSSDGYAPFEGIETTYDPNVVSQWGEFHAAVDELPEDEKAVVDLIWYHDKSKADAAKEIGVDVRTIRRRWQRARLALHERLQGEIPG